LLVSVFITVYLCISSELQLARLLNAVASSMNHMALVHKLHFIRSISFATCVPVLMLAHFHVQLIFDLIWSDY